MVKRDEYTGPTTSVSSVDNSGDGVPVAPPPRLSDFDCYRKYLNAYYVHKKSLRAGFSFRKFSRLAGFKSPNYLQLVIQGERSLANMTGERLAQIIGLKGAEREYFTALVQFENASNATEREQSKRRKVRALREMRSHSLGAHLAEVLEAWHHMVVRELSFLNQQKMDPDSIAQQLMHFISPDQAAHSLEILLRTGLLKVNESGRLEASEPLLETGDKIFTRELIEQLHSQTLHMWSQNLSKFSVEERELGITNIPISEDKIPELKKRIRDFQSEIIGWLQSEDKPDRFVQLGVYLIPFEKT